jgi:hypothetical protein
MTTEQVRELLSLASRWFPGVGFPNAAEAKEWASSMTFTDYADGERALRSYWKDPERKEKRPRIGAVLSRLSRPTSVSNNPSHAELLGGQMGCQKLEAVVRHYRGEWVRYCTSANERMHGLELNPASMPVIDLAKAQGEGFRTHCRISVLSCLIAEGVSMDSATWWADGIFCEVSDFQIALDYLRGNGMEQAPKMDLNDRKKVTPLLVMFQPMPGVAEKKAEMLNGLAAQLAADHAVLPTEAEQERPQKTYSAPSFQELEL